jgi:hypothetical protein
MCDTCFSYKEVVGMGEVALPWQFLAVILLVVFFEDIFLQPDLMAVHEENLVFE